MAFSIKWTLRVIPTLFLSKSGLQMSSYIKLMFGIIFLHPYHSINICNISVAQGGKGYWSGVVFILHLLVCFHLLALLTILNL